MIKREAIRYEVRDHIAYLTLSRPEKKNAINQAMRHEVQEAYKDIKFNNDIWLAILGAEGDVFCAGKDLFEKIPPGEEDPRVMSNDELYAFQRGIYKPIIVAVNGPCYAQGAGFALNSDVVIMAEHASIGWPQVRRGISSVSGPSLCAHALPWHQAMGYLMRAKPIPAQECLKWGIANAVVPADQVMATAERWAAEILENAPIAVRAVKEAARRGQEMDFESRMYMARDVADRVLLSEDSKEGIRAFREKRAPRWQGR